MKERAALYLRKVAGTVTFWFAGACLVLSVCLLVVNGIGTGVGASGFHTIRSEGSAPHARATVGSTNQPVGAHTYWGTDDVPPLPKPHESTPPAPPARQPSSPSPAQPVVSQVSTPPTRTGGDTGTTTTPARARRPARPWSGDDLRLHGGHRLPCGLRRARLHLRVPGLLARPPGHDVRQRSRRLRQRAPHRHRGSVCRGLHERGVQFLGPDGSFRCSHRSLRSLHLKQVRSYASSCMTAVSRRADATLSSQGRGPRSSVAAPRRSSR